MHSQHLSTFSSIFFSNVHKSHMNLFAMTGCDDIHLNFHNYALFLKNRNLQEKTKQFFKSVDNYFDIAWIKTNLLLCIQSEVHTQSDRNSFKELVNVWLTIFFTTTVFIQVAREHCIREYDSESLIKQVQF